MCGPDSGAYGSLGSWGHVDIHPTRSDGSHKILVGTGTQSNVRRIQSADEGRLVYHPSLRPPFHSFEAVVFPSESVADANFRPTLDLVDPWWMLPHLESVLGESRALALGSVVGGRS